MACTKMPVEHAQYLRRATNWMRSALVLEHSEGAPPRRGTLLARVQDESPSKEDECPLPRKQRGFGRPRSLLANRRNRCPAVGHGGSAGSSASTSTSMRPSSCCSGGSHSVT